MCFLEFFSTNYQWQVRTLQGYCISPVHSTCSVCVCVCACVCVCVCVYVCVCVVRMCVLRVCVVCVCVLCVCVLYVCYMSVFMCIRSSETCTPCHLWDLLPACRFRQVVALQRCKYTCTTKAWRRPALYVAHEWWLPYTLCMMTIESFYCAYVAMYTSLSMCAT